MVILFMYHTQKKHPPHQFPFISMHWSAISNTKKGNLHIKRRVSFFPRASFCTFVPLRSENLLSSVKNSTQETCMSHVFCIFVVLRGKPRTQVFTGAKPRKEYRLGESYVTLMLLLCSSYSWRELEGYHNCLPKQERETPGKSRSAFMKTKESQQ